MGRYLAVRIGQMAGTVFAVLTILFFVIRLSGDPVLMLLPPDATAAQIEALRGRLGLADPLGAQYLRFLQSALRGDFGDSLMKGGNAFSLVLERIPATLLLSLAALALSVLIALPAGIFAADRRGRVPDRLVITLTVIGQAVPGFWLGLLLIYFFSVRLGIFPTGGSETLRHCVLPTVTLAAYSTARLTRFVRSTMIDEMRKNYIRTERAAGTGRRRILLVYAFRNTLLPLITIVGLDLGTMLGGALVTETVFAWPGIGRLLMESLSGRDYPVIYAAVFLIAVMFSLLNLITDLLYGLADPQIRIAGRT